MNPIFERIMEDIDGEIRSFDFDVERDRAAWQHWAILFSATFGDKVEELEGFRALYDELFTPLDGLKLARDRLSWHVEAGKSVKLVQDYIELLREQAPGLLMNCSKIADLLEGMVGKKA